MILFSLFHTLPFILYRRGRVSKTLPLFYFRNIYALFAGIPDILALTQTQNSHKDTWQYPHKDSHFGIRYFIITKDTKRTQKVWLNLSLLLHFISFLHRFMELSRPLPAYHRIAAFPGSDL